MGDSSVRRRDETAWRTVAGHMVVVNVAGGTAHGLNPTGALLWDRLTAAGAVAEGELTQLLVERFGLAAEAAEADVRAFLVELERLGLVTVEAQDPDHP